MTIYGYARVSGTSQDLEGQIAELREKGHCTVIYNEKLTGTTTDRKEFQKLLAEMKSGDTLTVTKLDRFARSAEDGISPYQGIDAERNQGKYSKHGYG